MDQKIIFVRHGSLPEEYAKLIIGVCDVPLSERGQLEAGAIGRYLADKPIECVYTGTLTRVQQTLETARKIAKNMPNPLLDKRLNEMDFGEWSFRTSTEIPLKMWDIGNPDFVFPGGEKMSDFMARTRAFLSELRASGHRNVAVFSHGGVIMALLAEIIGLDRGRQFNLWVERGAVAEVIYTEDQPRLCKIFKPENFI